MKRINILASLVIFGEALFLYGCDSFAGEPGYLSSEATIVGHEEVCGDGGNEEEECSGTPQEPPPECTWTPGGGWEGDGCWD